MTPIRYECRTGTAGVGIVRERRSITINVEDSFGKGPRRFTVRPLREPRMHEHPPREAGGGVRQAVADGLALSTY